MWSPTQDPVSPYSSDQFIELEVPNKSTHPTYCNRNAGRTARYWNSRADIIDTVKFKFLCLMNGKSFLIKDFHYSSGKTSPKMA